jgi:O-antigen ligase
MHEPSPRRASLEHVSGDVRHATLGVLAASILSSAQSPSVLVAGLALAMALPDLARRHDLLPEGLACLTALTYWASVTWSVLPTLSDRVATDQMTVAGLFVAYRLAITHRRALFLVSVGYLGGCLLLLRRLLRENSGADLSLETAGVRYTVEGVNQNYVAFSVVGGVAVAVLLIKLVPRGAPIFVGAGVLCWTGVVLNDTRAALLAAAMIVGWWLLVPGRLRRAGLRALWVGVGVVGVGIFAGWADEHLQRLVPVDIDRDAGGLNGRLDFWPYARDAFWDHPLLGLGAGAVTRELPNGVFAHNVGLDVGTSAGVAGLLVFGAFGYATVWRATRDAEPILRRIMAGLVLCAVAAPLLTGYWYQAAPLWLLLAIFSRVSCIRSAPQDEDGDGSTATVGGRARVRH